ncbi:cysteine proteinase [Lentithecium fluviatile CBS 122367]|uniref:Cysteine proteinase n=1 Tax=Lentithecium fluviatile CBS 122367 TaxID=1168545 RepID=A0A6G1IVT6_9PLEO|nr:cysteine proteinase [Lentithecium fluviatile CBS 122367]
MSKRPLDHDALLLDPMDWDESPPPSPIALLRMPGQWHQPSLDATVPGVSVYTTIGDFYHTMTIRNLIRLPWILARRFFRRQVIRAEPVIRDDGARKKRLIDLGAADTPTTARANFTQRVQLNQRQARSPQRNMPGQWPESPTTTVLNDIWRGAGLEGPATPTLAPVNAANVANAPAFYSTTLDDDWGSPACASTPYGHTTSWYMQKSPTKAPSPQSRKLLTLVSKKVGTDGQSQQFKPVINKLLRIDRSPAGGSHTKLAKPSVNRTPVKKILKNCVAYQLAVAKIAEDAHKAGAEYKVEQEARTIHNAEPRPKEDAEKANTSFVYVNDLSTLSDALSPPRKKSVTFPDQVHAKPFFRDSVVADMQDSILVDIKTCDDPTQARAQIQQQTQQQNTTGDDDDDSLPLPQGSPEKDPSDDDDAAVYKGVPPETFYPSDDSADSVNDSIGASLEESMMSSELISDLYESVEKKLVISAPQPPAPPVVTTQPLVAELTKSELDKLESVAERTDNGRRAGAEIVKEKLTAHDFGTLLPAMFNGDVRAWLNDNIINEYLSILVEHKKKAEGFVRQRNGPAPPVHAFLSQWYQNMKKDKTRVERWAGRQNLDGAKFLDAQLLFFPICDSAHWRLLVIKPQERKIEYYDSLGGSGEQYTDIALQYIEMTLGRHYVASEWRVSTEQRSLQQKNASDCGIFTVLNALVLLRGEAPNRVVVNRGMEAARRRVAITLMAGKPTTEMD